MDVFLIGRKKPIKNGNWEKKSIYRLNCHIFMLLWSSASQPPHSGISRSLKVMVCVLTIFIIYIYPCYLKINRDTYLIKSLLHIYYCNEYMFKYIVFTTYIHCISTWFPFFRKKCPIRNLKQPVKTSRNPEFRHETRNYSGIIRDSV